MKDSISLEQKKTLSKLAAKYRSDGYEVELNASVPQLTKSFHNFRADLVARRDDETVILEVKSYVEMSKDSHLARLAKTINGIPGWRFEVVVLKPKREAPGTNPELLNVKDLNNRTRIADKLGDRNEFDLAMLVIWTNVEALLRHVANIEGIKLENQSTEYILKKLLSYGLLTKKVYKLFSEGLKYRNKLVHGYKISSLHKSKLNVMADSIAALIKSLKVRLIAEEKKLGRRPATLRKG